MPSVMRSRGAAILKDAFVNATNKMKARLKIAVMMRVLGLKWLTRLREYER